jgi:hypothetical protein
MLPYCELVPAVQVVTQHSTRLVVIRVPLTVINEQYMCRFLPLMSKIHAWTPSASRVVPA